MIAPAVPALAGNGLAMRLGVFLEALQRVADVDLLVLPIAGAADAPLSLPDALDIRTTIIPVAGRRDTAFELLSRLADASTRLETFRRYGRSSLAAQLSMAVLADVAAFAAGRRYDLVHVGRAYMAEAGLRVPGRPLLSVDIDENDALAWRSLAASRKRTGSPQAASFAEAEADAHARGMREYLPRYDAHFACSSAEARSVGAWLGGRQAVVVANAASVRNLPHRHDDGRTLVFVGTLGYEPNVAGLDWFARRVWPMVLAKARRAPRLLIAGSGHHETISRISRRPGIQVMGAVTDVGSVYARATIAIAPMRAGGGTRIKIVEAALAKIPVVATSFAAAGLPLCDKRDLWLADDAPAFADAVLEALSQRSMRTRYARCAASRLFHGHERSRVVGRLAREVEGLLNTKWARETVGDEEAT